MSDYIENEVKILNIDAQEVAKLIERLGATKVFDGKRVFTTFDTTDRFYTKNNTIIRLTEEGKLKLSVSYMNENGDKETIKLFTSRKKETVDFLSRLNVVPIARVESHRVSYELDDIDFDIDKFPKIPPFLEVDIGADSKYSLDELVRKLRLDGNELVSIGTEDIYSKYGKDYFELFAV